MESPEGSNNNTLQPHQIKELLTDVEELGGRAATDRENGGFLETQNKNPRIYQPGLKRKFQKQLANYKRRSATSYYNLVLEHGVTPSAATIREKEEEEAAKKAAKEATKNPSGESSHVCSFVGSCFVRLLSLPLAVIGLLLLL